MLLKGIRLRIFLIVLFEGWLFKGGWAFAALTARARAHKAHPWGRWGPFTKLRCCLRSSRYLPVYSRL